MAAFLAAGALQAGGAIMTNNTNQAIAHEQMQFQAESQNRQQKFAERMSNTAYQRAMADMEKAGLNPILAYNQGGASTPQTSVSPGASATMQNPFAGAVSSAVDAKRAYQEIANMKKTNTLIDSQTAKNMAERDLAIDNQALVKANSAKSKAERRKLQSDTIRSWVDTVGNQLNNVRYMMQRR